MESMGEEAPAPPFVHPGVQGRDRGSVPVRRPVDRPGGPGLRPDRDRGASGSSRPSGTPALARTRSTTAERQELAELRRENHRLREDVEILKRATAFFVKETR